LSRGPLAPPPSQVMAMVKRHLSDVFLGVMVVATAVEALILAAALLTHLP